jgi:hypothetical protein
MTTEVRRGIGVVILVEDGAPSASGLPELATAG